MPSSYSVAKRGNVYYLRHRITPDGHHVHEAVLSYGAKVTGATVHFADNEHDHGPFILQEALPVADEDTPDSLAKRVQPKEHELYPKAIQLFAEGRPVCID